MSYAIVLATGIWIGSILIPWLQNMKSLLTCKPQQETRLVANASHKFTANAQQIAAQATANTSNSSSPKARARRFGMLDHTLKKAPTLYDYGGRVHISPYCTSGVGMGLEVLSIAEPCSQCTNSRTLLTQEDLYRTNKGEKYHTRICHHIQSRPARGTSQAHFARALTTCRCVLEHYQQFRQLEDHNDNEH